MIGHCDACWSFHAFFFQLDDFTQDAGEKCATH